MRYLILASALLFVPGAAVGQEATDSARQAEVLRAVHGFHHDLVAGDSVGALQRLHAEVLIHESGHAETLEEYRAGHLPADMAFAAATRRERTAERVELWGDVALYTSASRTTGEWRGRQIEAHGAETIVLVRTADGWRILHIHWSSR